VTVDRDRRAALIALRISDGGIEKLTWLHRGLEVGGAREAKQILAPALIVAVDRVRSLRSGYGRR
jgi:hypothetical protein